MAKILITRLADCSIIIIYVHDPKQSVTLYICTNQVLFRHKVLTLILMFIKVIVQPSILILHVASAVNLVSLS